jgi:hypothetical protein
VVSSPPYAESPIQGGGANAYGAKKQFDATGIWPRGSLAQTARAGPGYGTTPAQLGALPTGDFNAVVSSPPYQDSIGSDDPVKRGGLFRDPKRSGDRNLTGEYGQTPGQLGQEPPDTFWSAARLIIAQCYRVLRPGGVAVWVVKAFVRAGRIVDFPGQWRDLCIACGFEQLHEHHAWLVEDLGTQFDLEGNSHANRKEHKSFFRRLAESKGSPRIDYEVVLCMLRPATGPEED